MILCMAAVLSSDELSKMQNQLAEAEFMDGKLTAGWHAKQVNNNHQIRSHSPVAIKLAGTVMRAVQQHEKLKATGCMDKCKAGPNLLMPGKMRYSRVNPQSIPGLMAEHFTRADDSQP